MHRICTEKSASSPNNRGNPALAPAIFQKTRRPKRNLHPSAHTTCSSLDCIGLHTLAPPISARHRASHHARQPAAQYLKHGPCLRPRHHPPWHPRQKTQTRQPETCRPGGKGLRPTSQVRARALEKPDMLKRKILMVGLKLGRRRMRIPLGRALRRGRQSVGGSSLCSVWE